jgi:biopolymer transport protein ExbD
VKRTRDPTQDVGRSVPVDMTSLVDVTFQLLVFLLVVNDLSAKQMEDVELPDAQNATEIRPDDAAFVVNVLPPEDPAEGGTPRFRINGRDVPHRELRHALHAVAELHRPPAEPRSATQAAVQIRADRGAPWRHVQLVMQECARQDVQIRRIQFATRPPDVTPIDSATLEEIR